MALTLFERIKNLLSSQRAAQWTIEERVALIRVLYSACVADEAYSSKEQEWLTDTMRSVGVAWEDMQIMDLAGAVEILTREPAREAELYRLLAEALFSDGDFDRAERNFVSRLCAEQGLSRPKLEGEIQRVRGRILDDALTDWNREIEARGEGQDKP